MSTPQTNRTGETLFGEHAPTHNEWGHVRSALNQMVDPGDHMTLVHALNLTKIYSTMSQVIWEGYRMGGERTLS
jgi:hypothetical protein